MNKSISVVLPNFNGKDLLKTSLPFTFEALQHARCKYEIILVDDCSTDNSAAFLQENYPEITILENDRYRGLAYSCNQGIREAKYDLVLLLKPDIKLSPDYLVKLIPHFSDEDTLGVMGKILDETGQKIEEAAKIPYFNGYKLKSDKQAKPSKLSAQKIPTTFLSVANCLLDRKKLVELDGFDEIYSPFYAEDLDLGIRAWKLGWKCYYEDSATCMHLGARTAKSYVEKRKVKEIYFRNRMLFHAIHMNRKDLKRWRLYVLFAEVIPKTLLGKFWILRSYAGLKDHKQQIRKSRSKIRTLMLSKYGRKSIAEVTEEIHSMLLNKDLIRF